MDGQRRSSLRSGLPRSVKFAPRIREMIETSPSEEAIFKSDLVARCVGEWDGMTAKRAEDLVASVLKRLLRDDSIRRLWRGAYTKVKEVQLGDRTVRSVNITRDEALARFFMLEDGKRIGYVTDASLQNRVGLSTMVPRATWIASNKYRRTVPKGANIVVRKPATVVTDENVLYLQMVDLIRNLSRQHVNAERPYKIVHRIIRELKFDGRKLIWWCKKLYKGDEKLLKRTRVILRGRQSGPKTG